MVVDWRLSGLADGAGRMEKGVAAWILWRLLAVSTEALAWRCGLNARCAGTWAALLLDHHSATGVSIARMMLTGPSMLLTKPPANPRPRYLLLPA